MANISRKTISLAVLALVIYLTFIFTYHDNYHNTKNIILSENDAKISLIEESIMNETKYSEVVSKIAEKETQREMEFFSYDMLDKYEANPNVLSWDLKAMKEEYNGLDIYIIDQDLEITASTIDSEVGLSLASYPSFAQTLRNRMASDRFRSDSINYSFIDKELKKFSYMPTPDHKYLLEFSVTMQERFPELESLDVLYLTKALKDKYSFVEQIKVYKYDVETGATESLFTETALEEVFEVEKDLELMREVVENLQPLEQIIERNNEIFSVKYLPYYLMNTEMKMNWWGTYLIEIVYNYKDVDDALVEQKIIFIQNIFLVSLLYFGFLLLLFYVTRQNRRMIYTDCLTKLSNRKYLEEYMAKAIPDANKRGKKIAFLFFDLDKFKAVNDQYGHRVGDEVLKESARRIKEFLSDKAVVIRMGGDEFLAVEPDFDSIEEIEEFAKNRSEIFAQPFKINDLELDIKSSIGLAYYPEHGSDTEELISYADKEMYKAKMKGR